MTGSAKPGQNMSTSDAVFRTTHAHAALVTDRDELAVRRERLDRRRGDRVVQLATIHLPHDAESGRRLKRRVALGDGLGLRHDAGRDADASANHLRANDGPVHSAAPIRLSHVLGKPFIAKSRFHSRARSAGSMERAQAHAAA